MGIDSAAMIPLSSTKVMPRRIGWLAVRAHECDEHNVVERKRFWKRESAVRWAEVWMDYRWLPCFEGADLS